jgi:hypothetical protein
MKRFVWVLGAAALVLGGCAQGNPEGPDDFGYNGTGIQVSIAPLTLDTLSDACYSFQINNEQGDLVVARGPQSAAGGSGDSTANAVCASRFGNGDGGDISYVAPCDAQPTPNDTDAVNTHTVTLWVDALCLGPDAENVGADCDEIQSYVDPCPSGCSLAVACAENADTPVTFNFTIMGQADQGFFDVAVNFDDVFCSAKLDDCNTLDQPIELVFDPNPLVQTSSFPCIHADGCAADGSAFDPNATPPVLWGQQCPDNTQCTSDPGCYLDCSPFKVAYLFGEDVPVFGPNPNYGERIRTGVAAVACTAGPDSPSDDVTTLLLMSTLTVECDDPEGGTISGTLDLAGLTAEGNVAIGPFPGLVTFGTEALAGVNKVFTTVSVGLGDYTNCNFLWNVAPVEPGFEEAWGNTNTWNSHGYVQFNGGALGGDDTVCHQNELNASGSAVTTEYVDSNNAGVLASSWVAELAQGAEVFGSVSFGGDGGGGGGGGGDGDETSCLWNPADFVIAGAACSVGQAEHPSYTTIAQDVALCGNNYDTADIASACGTGWHVCLLSEWNARYTPGVAPGGTLTSWGALQTERCAGGVWMAGAPLMCGQYIWSDTVCGNSSYNPWNSVKVLLANDGATILAGDGGHGSWDTTFGPASSTDRFAVYCCKD